AEDQVGGSSLLQQLAGDSRAQLECAQVIDLIECHQCGATGGEGVDSLPARPKRILDLQVASAHVIEGHRPSYMGECVLGLDIPRNPSYDERELGLVVDVLGVGGGDQDVLT